MRRVMGLVLGLAFVLRFVGIDFSLPHRFVADTHVVRGALGMAQEKTLAPPPNKYTSYPYLLPMLLLPQYGALYAVGRVTGEYQDATDFGNKMIDDPTPLYRIARFMTTVFGLLTVLFTHRIVRRALGKHRIREADLAAYLVATSLLLVHLGKDVRPWVPVAAFTALTADRTLAWLRCTLQSRRADGVWRRGALMGACAGLAFACHQAGGLAVILPATAVIARLRAVPRAAIGAAFASAIGFGITALLFGVPYYLTGHSTDVAVSDTTTEGQFNLGGQSVRAEALGFDRFAETALGFASYEPVLLICALVGLLGLRHTRFRIGALPTVLVFPLVLCVLFLCYSGTHTRYLTPAIPLLAVFGGIGASAMLDRRGLARVIALVLLVVPTVQALRYDWVLSRADTRTEFLSQVAKVVPEGAVVALESHGPPLRYSQSAVARLEAFGQWASRAETREAAGETPRTPDRPPYSVVPLERFYEFQSAWPHQWLARGDDPARPVEKPIEVFLDEVGAEYLITVDRFPGAPRNSALDDVLARRGELLAQLAPSEDEQLSEAKLPMDPEVPGTAIWKVHRPGPLLKLWSIRR